MPPRLGKVSIEAKLGIVQVALAIPVLLITWFTVIDRPELVYEVRHQTPFIFRGSNPGGQGWQRVTGNLLILILENIGRRPSTDIRGIISLPGRILTTDKNIENPVYCSPQLDSKTSAMAIKIDRCAQGHPVEMFILYQKSKDEQPTIDIADDLGEVRRVSSIQREKDHWKWALATAGLFLGIFNGFLIISRLNKRFSAKIATSESQAALLISEARTKFEEGNLDSTLRFLRQAQALAPDMPQIYTLLGRLRKRQSLDIDPHTMDDRARALMEEAKESCTQAIKINVEYEAAYYNRACYRSRLRESVPEIMADLRAAIELYPENKALALQDEDFTGNERFDELRALIEEL